MAKPQQQPITSQIDRASAAKAARPVNEFDVPDDLREEIAGDIDEASTDDVVTVGMRILTPGEERLAIKRSAGDVGQILYQLNCASLVAVTMADGTVKAFSRPGDAEAAYNRLHPKVRDLVTQGYNDLHRPTEEAGKAFLKSRRVRI